MPALETETSAPPVKIKLTVTPSDEKSAPQFEALLNPILKELKLPEPTSQERKTIPNSANGRDTVTDYNVTIDTGSMVDNMRTQAALNQALEEAGIVNYLNNGPIVGGKK